MVDPCRIGVVSQKVVSEPTLETVLFRTYLNWTVDNSRYLILGLLNSTPIDSDIVFIKLWREYWIIRDGFS